MGELSENLKIEFFNHIYDFYSFLISQLKHVLLISPSQLLCRMLLKNTRIDRIMTIFKRNKSL